MGINDIAGAADPTVFQSAIVEWAVREARASGLNIATNVIVATPNWVTYTDGGYQTIQPTIVQAAIDAATATGAMLIDVNAATESGGDTLLS